MKHEVVLGKLITGDEKRDAIHIAVAPVVANEKLAPGMDIGLVEGTERVGQVPNPIGIVDPFLNRAVMPDEKFWMFLYPQTITSLRHEWTHPSFEPEKVAQVITDKAYSEMWLKAYASRMNTYDDGIEAAYQRLVDGLKSREILSYGSDLHSFGDLNDADQLKEHAERVLGIKINWSEYQFRCSC